MGQFFKLGEKKVRAGVYNRISSDSAASYAGVRDGIVACVVKAEWGPLNTVVKLTKASEVSSVFGNGGTVAVIQEIFDGGASEVRAVRLGSGGTNGTVTLKDTNSTAADAVKVTAKYPGKRTFQYMVRTGLDGQTKEFVVWDGTRQIEKLVFPISADGEVDALVKAGEESSYFTFAKVSAYAGNGVVATTEQSQFPEGTSPTATTESYSDAFTLLETQTWNTICVDTNDVAVHAILASYVARLYEEGKLGFGVVGEPSTVALADRQAHAKAFNNKSMVYAGHGWVDSLGAKHEGYLFAARLAGLIASVSSAYSLVHTSVTGAVDLTEMLTNEQYVECINAGMVMLSISANGIVWIENANTTLVNPSAEEDDGWKKIKRTKIRYELLTRASETVEPLVGKVNNDMTGQNAVLTALGSLINAMVAENKLLASSTVSLDGDNPPQGDSAWFVFDINDIDSLEKIYMHFKFRFSSES